MKKNTIKPLPPKSRELMINLAEILGLESFILFGGSAIDTLIDFPTEKRDFDIGVKRKKGCIRKCKASLKKFGYRLVGEDRPYFINLFEPVLMVFAQKNNSVLDISFMNNVWHVGQFDIGSLFYRYPELDYVDRYCALGAMKNKTIRPIHGLDKENPYFLANRIINLCAKYEMKLFGNVVHRDFIRILKRRIHVWNPSELFRERFLQQFHGKMARIAHYSTVLKAIKRSQDRVFFVKDLAATKLLSETMPEIQKPLENLSPQKEKLLQRAKTKEEIANFLIRIAVPDDRKSLKQKFLFLRLRNWDLQDREIKMLQ